MNDANSTSRRDFLRLVVAGSAGLALAANGVSAKESATDVKRPNILFLMTDQFRADCMGCSGNKVIKTPNLDRIANDGIRFTQAYSSTPSCTPARAGLLTGLSPWHHGMLGYGKVAERYSFELPSAMHDAGYYTYAIGKLHYAPQRNYHGFDGALVDESGRVQSPGFVSDYRKWFHAKAATLDPDATGIGWNEYRSGVYALPEELHPTRWTGDKAVEFIGNYDRKEPFFLKVSFARPHSPYDPPKRFMDMYKAEDMPAPHVGKWAEKYAEIDNPKDLSLWHGDLGLEQARKSRQGYYGSVSFIDEQIGRIVKSLEERGMLENTLIVFTADHGDMLGDHNLWRKTYAYDGSAHIPMLMRWPKSMGMDSRRGSTAAQPVELRDILPTCLDAAGKPAPEKKLDGASLLDIARGRTDHWREYIDLEHDVCYAKENHWNALTDGRWKYIYHAFDGSQQLFDLSNDPGELHDLASDPKHAAELKTWRQRIVKHFAERGDAFVKDGELVVRPQKMLYSPLYPGKAEAGSEAG